MRRIRRFRGSLLLPLALLVASIGAFTGPARATGGASPTPARPGSAIAEHQVIRPAGGITAVVVKSWGGCSSSSLIWDDLNANWSAYGSIPIAIDYADPALCGDSFTLADLEASGAGVVILDDPAGGLHQFTLDEAAALRTYALEGHNVIGTYLVFQYPSQGIDNRALAPLFGLQSNLSYTGGQSIVTPTYELRDPSFHLFRDISNPYVSTGFEDAQTPADGAWSRNELVLRKAARMGLTADRAGAIIVNRRADYATIFISNMPEYGGGTADKQFFYNAIIFPAT